MKRQLVLFFSLIMLSFFSLGAFPAIDTPYEHEDYDEINNDVLRLASESMGGFFDAMKSYIIYTAGQNVPGAKESGVGYYYDTKTGKMARRLFYRIGSGYPRETNRPLDLAISGKGLFAVELPGGWPAYTHDGRFELDDNNRLVMQAHPFPVLGESGYIYLPNDDVYVTEEGVIYAGDTMVDILQIKWFKDGIQNLDSFNQAIFHLKEEDFKSGAKNLEPDFMVMQGYVQDASVTKGYIGLVPEWSSGHESNVKVVKAYVKAMQMAIQQADPR